MVMAKDEDDDEIDEDEDEDDEDASDDDEDVSDGDGGVIGDDEDGADHQNARNSPLACAIIAWASLKWTPELCKSR